MKKPSKIKTVTAKKAWLMLPNFRAITLFGTVYCAKKSDVEKINKTDEVDSQLESHETIHVRQAESTNNSWLSFYWKYFWQWVGNLPLIFVNIYAPYKFMAFELEAYRYQDDWDYCLGKCVRWEEYSTLTLKQKKAFAKEYYKNSPKPYFPDFIKEKIDPIL